MLCEPGRRLPEMPRIRIGSVGSTSSRSRTARPLHERVAAARQLRLKVSPSRVGRSSAVRSERAAAPAVEVLDRFGGTSRARRRARAMPCMVSSPASAAAPSLGEVDVPRGEERSRGGCRRRRSPRRRRRGRGTPRAGGSRSTRRGRGRRGGARPGRARAGRRRPRSAFGTMPTPMCRSWPGRTSASRSAVKRAAERRDWRWLMGGSWVAWSRRRRCRREGGSSGRRAGGSGGRGLPGPQGQDVRAALRRGVASSTGRDEVALVGVGLDARRRASSSISRLGMPRARRPVKARVRRCRRAGELQRGARASCPTPPWPGTPCRLDALRAEARARRRRRGRR